MKKRRFTDKEVFKKNRPSAIKREMKQGEKTQNSPFLVKNEQSQRPKSVAKNKSIERAGKWGYCVFQRLKLGRLGQ